MQYELIDQGWLCRVIVDESDKGLLGKLWQKELAMLAQSNTPLLSSLCQNILKIIPDATIDASSIALPHLVSGLIYPDHSDLKTGCCEITHMYWSDKYIGQIEYKEMRHNTVVQVHGFVHRSNGQPEEENGHEDFLDHRKNLFYSLSCKSRAADYMRKIRAEFTERFFSDSPENMAAELVGSVKTTP